MSASLNRRQFVKAAVVAGATVPAVLGAEPPVSPTPPMAGPTGPLAPVQGTLPKGKIQGMEFSRLMLGGNLIGGYAHSRDLAYVSHLMKRYNTDAKILETLELAEIHGITVINSWVQDGIAHLQQHWKRGGKMKWIAQVRINPNGDFGQIQKAADLGASAIHVTGDVADALVAQGKLDVIARLLDFIRERQCIAGVGAHGLATIVECEKAKLNPDFYVKTLHSHAYHTAPKPGETDDLGRYDNSWCSDPEAVVDVMFTVQKPWIAFKVLAAGAIPPAQGFRYAFEGGADFILVGMFDWQIAEDAQLTREVLADLKRVRPWRS
ncbi:MAG TPA: hypothetical protein PKM73_16960 [Verrucomicrobiota bacterium]|nr:hypothetical protein [Verrucomicrobiota bacterium]HNU52927.1 hypothetical protein [Verrucomicrobiota bacterium]